MKVQISANTISTAYVYIWCLIKFRFIESPKTQIRSNKYLVFAGILPSVFLNNISYLIGVVSLVNISEL